MVRMSKSRIRISKGQIRIPKKSDIIVGFRISKNPEIWDPFWLLLLHLSRHKGSVYLRLRGLILARVFWYLGILNMPENVGLSITNRTIWLASILFGLSFHKRKFSIILRFTIFHFIFLAFQKWNRYLHLCSFIGASV